MQQEKEAERMDGMESVSAKLRKKVINIMGDGMARDISDIKQALEEREGFRYEEDYREGHLAGCMRKLKISGQLRLVERGIYQLAVNPQESERMNDNVSNESESSVLLPKEMRTKVSLELRRQYEELLRYMNEVTLSSLDADDFEDARFLLELKSSMKKLLEQHHIILP